MKQLPSTFVPDFLIIPYQLIVNPRTKPIDQAIYGILYWKERIQGGPCNPTNDEIADFVGADSGTVQNSLTRQEKEGFITRYYADESKRTRTGITTNVSYKGSAILPQSLEIATREETPRSFARRFFEGDKEAVGEIGTAALATGMDRVDIMREIKKFTDYWTEPTASGKKQRWELEKTFEVKRRFVTTWLGRKLGDKASRKGNVV